MTKAGLFILQYILYLFGVFCVSNKAYLLVIETYFGFVCSAHKVLLYLYYPQQIIWHYLIRICANINFCKFLYLYSFLCWISHIRVSLIINC